MRPYCGKTEELNLGKSHFTLSRLEKFKLANTLWYLSKLNRLLQKAVGVLAFRLFVLPVPEVPVLLVS